MDIYVQFLATVNEVTKNLVWTLEFHFSGVSSCRMAGSYGKCMFNVLRNCKTISKQLMYH